MAKKVGRPNGYNASVTDSICAALAEGKSLVTVCGLEGMPNPATVYRWLEAHDEFREKYARAREIQVDVLVAQIVDIADNCREGKKVKVSSKDGVTEEFGDMVERSKLQIDARKWYASKVMPKKYGDRLELAGDLTLSVADVLRDRRAKRLPAPEIATTIDVEE